MARYEFRLPDVGEGVAEAEIVAWHVKPGDEVAEDQPLADMMTDKATVEMESPVQGRVLELGGAVGDQLPVGSVLVVLETEADAPPPDEVPAPREPAKEKPAAKARTREPSPTLSGHVAASPAVRKRAHDLGIDLKDVPSAGGDRVRHSDLDAFLVARAGSSPARAPTPPASPPPDERDQQIKIVGLRRRIAAAMQESKRRIPHFSYVEEVDVTALEALRRTLNAGDGPHLTMLPFLIAALCQALADFPQINATFDDEAGVVTRHAAVHMGVATQTDVGLVVPVVRNAQDRDLAGLAAEILRVTNAARSGDATSEDLSGSTLTITSLGALGGIVSTPIINRPEVAIVGINRMADRPVAIERTIEIRTMMNLSSSFDHRVVDGWDAASFIQKVKTLLEVPEITFLRR